MRHLLIVLFLAACARPHGAPAVPPPAARGPDADTARVDARATGLDTVAHLYAGWSSHLRDSVRLVVRDSADFARVWNRIYQWRIPPKPVPRLAFAHDMVLVVTTGRRGSRSDQIRVDSLRRQGDELVVHVLTTLLRPGCGSGGSAESGPTDVVLAPRHDGPVRFVERRGVSRTCLDPWVPAQGHRNLTERLPSSRAERGPSPGFRDSVVVLYDNIYSGVSDATEEVIRDVAALARAWERLNIREPMPAVPPFDPAIHTAFLVTMGTQPSTGYDVRLDSLRTSGDTLHVYVGKEAPDPDAGCMEGSAITRPALLVRLPRHDGPIAFHAERRLVRCWERMPRR